jgi:glutamate-1-semialdehyde 2,1-aminomutase
MSGLKFKGVSNKLKDTSFPFSYNDFASLKKLIKTKNIGIIKMEVMRNVEPKNNFLKKIRTICNQKKIILIFDECTSGFRESLGGIHMRYGVKPDLAIFGKAIGNGYAINAIIGKKKYMKNCEETFISSTFWTERSGSAAAIATINLMKKKKSYHFVKKQGKKIKNIWRNLSSKYNVPIDIIGLDSIPSFVFKKKHLLYKTFLTQEMLKKNIIASTFIYISICHNDKILEKYAEALEEIFSKIKNKEIFIEGKISYSPMKRLN